MIRQERYDLNEKKQYEAGKHMAMLQFSLKNYLLDKSYTAITIDIKNAIIKFAQINNYD